MSIPPLTSSGYVDSVVQALMPEFLDNLDEMMQDLRLAWKSRDMELLQGIAHDIKGSAGLYGLLAISQKAAQLQKAARNHDYHLIGSCLNELQQQHRAALHGLQSSISIG